MGSFSDNKEEIYYNLINCAIAGLISFFSGVLAIGTISFKAVCIGLFSASLVAVVKFKDYWDSEKGEYSKKMFNFL